MITLDAFRSSVSDASPPKDARPALQALWWAAKGDWNEAHKCVQAHEDDAECNWVHAHLHHQEGDMSNGGYWYRRAGQSYEAYADAKAELAAIKAVLTY